MSAVYFQKKADAKFDKSFIRRDFIKKYSSTWCSMG